MNNFSVKGLRKLAPVFFMLVLFLVSGLPGMKTYAAANVVAAARANVLKDGELVSNSRGVRYRRADKKYATDQWAVVNGNVYLFGENGYAVTGGFAIDGKAYFASSKGVLYVNRRLYSADKTKVWYYGSDGARVKSTWVKIAGKYYYFNAKGLMVRNMKLKDSYVDSTGARVTSKWIKTGGKYYFYNAAGILRRNCWVGSFYVGPDGAKIEGLNRKTLLSQSKGKKTTTVSQEKKLIIVGASRVAMMRNVVGSNSKVLYIASPGKGYDWLLSTAEPKLDAYLQVFPNSTVVIQLGNNDLKNYNSYFAEYRKLMAKYPKVKFRFMDTLPGTNAKVNNVRMFFNRKLKENFPTMYIGGYDYLVQRKFTTLKDGTHYTPQTSRMIYAYILKKTGF